MSSMGEEGFLQHLDTTLPMASCSDLTRITSSTDVRFVTKGNIVPIPASKKLIEPFQRLKSRANLFRRKNYSSQLDLSSCHRSSLSIDHIIPSSPNPLKSTNNKENNNVTLLKRSNSMICPQEHLRTFLQTTDPRHQRNSVCFISKNESQRKLQPRMSHIVEDEVLTLETSTPVEVSMPVSSVSSSSSSSSSRPSSVLLRDQAETIRTRRQPHHHSRLLSQRQSLCSSIDEPFFDCHEISSSSKISTCTMTGQSLNNLDQCSCSSKEQGVQTIRAIHPLAKTISTSSLSSSTASILTDSLENKPPLRGKEEKASVNPRYKWPHLYERLLGEQTCIYWVNYLGSTAIKMSEDNPTLMPTNAITRLKESTQYARVLPIIGLSISSRGVEFLKHVKDRTVICVHPIKSIHCACQDQDLRYFAYVTREQRRLHGTSQSSGHQDHHYCHVFVVKNEAMSTEILLTFGQAFDLAYRLDQRVKHTKNLPVDQVRSLETMSSSIYSSSSPSSSDERKVFI